MFRQLIVNTLGINLWPEWDPAAAPAKEAPEPVPKRPAAEMPNTDAAEFGDYEPDVKRSRGDRPPSSGGNRRVSLEKLSEMERRLGLDRTSPAPPVRNDMRGPPGAPYQGGYEEGFGRGGYGGPPPHQRGGGGGRGGWAGRPREAREDWYGKN